jgi:hypothetical protein
VEPKQFRSELLARLEAGGTVSISVSKAEGGKVWLESHIEQAATGCIEVRISPAQGWLRTEWEWAASELKKGSADFEKASAAMRARFAELLAEELPRGELIPLSESTPGEESQDLNHGIDVELAARGRPLADSSDYAASQVWFPARQTAELLVTYRPRRNPSALEEWKSWVRGQVPGSFREPGLAEVARAGHRVVPIGLGDVLDSERFSAIDQDAEGTDERVREAVSNLGTEAFGWYQPYHVYDEEHWGIYLHADRVHDLGLALRERLLNVGCPTPNDAFELSVRLVLEHEMFHALVETFALGQELARHGSVYLTHTESVYKRTAGTAGHLEEALANYRARDKIRKMLDSWKTERNWSDAAVDVVHAFINELFAASPPGYRDWRVGARPEALRRFAAQAVGGELNPVDPLPPLESFLETASEIVILRKVPIWITAEEGIVDHLFATPSRREAAKFLQARGYHLRPGGKHPVFVAPSGTIFPLPTADPVSENVFRTLLHHFEISKKEYLSQRLSL